MIQVIKNTVREYDCYWNEESNKWVGILQATHYDENKQAPEVKEGKVVDYFEVVNLKK